MVTTSELKKWHLQCLTTSIEKILAVVDEFKKNETDLLLMVLNRNSSESYIKTWFEMPNGKIVTVTYSKEQRKFISLSYFEMETLMKIDL